MLKGHFVGIINTAELMTYGYSRYMMWSKPDGGMVHFLHTDIGANINRKIIIKFLFIVPIIATFLVAISSKSSLILFLGSIVIFVSLFMAFKLHRVYLHFPLAVNINHPWVDLEIGERDARVQIWTEEKGWFDIPNTPLKVTKDPLSRVSIILAEDGENTFLGNLPPVMKGREKTFLQWVNFAILNALLSNETPSEDHFLNAREREDQESGLLDREWGDTTPGSLDEYVELASTRK
jgi:hypothetical protein